MPTRRLRSSRPRRSGRPELDALPALRLIVSVRGEPVNVDLAAATARGIPVVHAPGRNAESVAEFTIGVMIALLRRIVSTHELVRRRVLTEDRPERVRPRGDVIWRPADSTATVPYRAFKGPGLRSTTLGLLGLGAIGASVAGLANALGMRVIGHDPYLAGDAAGRPAGLVRGTARGKRRPLAPRPGFGRTADRRRRALPDAPGSAADQHRPRDDPRLRRARRCAPLGPPRRRRARCLPGRAAHAGRSAARPRQRDSDTPHRGRVARRRAPPVGDPRDRPAGAATRLSRR